MAKGPGAEDKRGPVPNVSRKAKIPRGLSEKVLCALCFLFVHPLVLIPGDSKDTEESIPIA
jgi:hypothetical protein